MSETLGDALPKEIDRVRELISLYQETGSAGAFATAMMRASIKRAENAITDDDVVAMLAAYKDLQEYEA